MNKAIIFLSFTTSQNQSIQNCINYFKRVKPNNINYYIISNVNNIPKEIKDSHKLILTKISNWHKALHQILFKSNKKKLNIFVKRLPFYDEIEILMPHFLNILCNHFFNNYIEKLNSKNIIISLYPDGMLSYQPYKIVSKYQKESIFRWLGGLGSGMTYKLFKGPIADPFSCIKKIYSYIPEITIPYKSKQIIKIEFSKKKLSGNNILILGHYKQNKFNHLYLNKLNESLNKFFKENTYKKIFYKPHPRMISNIDKDIFYQFLLKIPDIDISLYQYEQPIESIVNTIGASTIIASVSTSMINLKLRFGEQISCYYFGISNYVLEPYIKYYESVFSKLSIKPLKVFNE